jgi:Zn-dependent protease
VLKSLKYQLGISEEQMTITFASALIFKALSAIIVITIHESVKAALSFSFGDALPKKYGRVTLNPAKHLELIGFIFGIFYGFCWGKPVPTSSANYKNRVSNTILVYSIPTLINFILGAASYQLARELGYETFIYAESVQLFCYTFSFVNFYTALFNLIPIEPGDMSRILSVILKPKTYFSISGRQTMLKTILIFLIFFNVISNIFSSVATIFGLIY